MEAPACSQHLYPHFTENYLISQMQMAKTEKHGHMHVTRLYQTRSRQEQAKEFVIWTLVDGLWTSFND